MLEQVDYVNTHDDSAEVQTPRSLLRLMFLLSGVAILVVGMRLGLIISSALFAARRSLESGLWVYRYDPNHRRGQVCGLFHVTVSIWHGAPSALIALVVLIFIDKRLGIPVAEVDVVPTLVALFAAIGLSALLGWISAVLALATKSKFWVNPRFYDALSRELRTGSNIYSNHGRFVIATSLSMPMLVILAMLLRNEVKLEGAAAVLFPVFLIAVPITAVILPLLWVSSKIFVNSPREYLLSDADAASNEP